MSWPDADWKTIGLRLIASKLDQAGSSEPSLVEAPGTAPGSEWLIARAVYHHSLPHFWDEHPQYRRAVSELKGQM